MKKKLIIWDFDGVIADSEKLWLINVGKTLKDLYNKDFDLTEIANMFSGQNEANRKEALRKIDIEPEDRFFNSINSYHGYIESLVPSDLTENIFDIFNLEKFSHCIGSNGSFNHTKEKVEKLKIDNIFGDNNIFSQQHVKAGKPEPDLFLFAAKPMGVSPENCFVIEDSLSGLTAAIKANITPISFTKNVHCDKTYFNKQIKI